MIKRREIIIFLLIFALVIPLAFAGNLPSPTWKEVGKTQIDPSEVTTGWFGLKGVIGDFKYGPTKITLNVGEDSLVPILNNYVSNKRTLQSASADSTFLNQLKDAKESKLSIRFETGVFDDRLAKATKQTMWKQLADGGMGTLKTSGKNIIGFIPSESSAGKKAEQMLQSLDKSLYVSKNGKLTSDTQPGIIGLDIEKIGDTATVYKTEESGKRSSIVSLSTSNPEQGKIVDSLFDFITTKSNDPKAQQKKQCKINDLLCNLPGFAANVQPPSAQIVKALPPDSIPPSTPSTSSPQSPSSPPTTPIDSSQGNMEYDDQALEDTLNALPIEQPTQNPSNSITSQPSSSKTTPGLNKRATASDVYSSLADGTFAGYMDNNDGTFTLRTTAAPNRASASAQQLAKFNKNHPTTPTQPAITQSQSPSTPPASAQTQSPPNPPSSTAPLPSTTPIASPNLAQQSVTDDNLDADSGYISADGTFVPYSNEQKIAQLTAQLTQINSNPVQPSQTQSPPSTPSTSSPQSLSTPTSPPQTSTPVDAGTLASLNPSDNTNGQPPSQPTNEKPIIQQIKKSSWVSDKLEENNIPIFNPNKQTMVIKKDGFEDTARVVGIFKDDKLGTYVVAEVTPPTYGDPEAGKPYITKIPIGNLAFSTIPVGLSEEQKAEIRTTANLKEKDTRGMWYVDAGESDKFKILIPSGLQPLPEEIAKTAQVKTEPLAVIEGLPKVDPSKFGEEYRGLAFETATRWQQTNNKPSSINMKMDSKGNPSIVESSDPSGMKVLIADNGAIIDPSNKRIIGFKDKDDGRISISVPIPFKLPSNGGSADSPNAKQAILMPSGKIYSGMDSKDAKKFVEQYADSSAKGRDLPKESPSWEVKWAVDLPQPSKYATYVVGSDLIIQDKDGNLMKIPYSSPEVAKGNAIIINQETAKNPTSASEILSKAIPVPADQREAILEKIDKGKKDNIAKLERMQNALKAAEKAKIPAAIDKILNSVTLQDGTHPKTIDELRKEIEGTKISPVELSSPGASISSSTSETSDKSSKLPSTTPSTEQPFELPPDWEEMGLNESEYRALYGLDNTEKINGDYLANGEQCTVDLECQSNYCDPKTEKCAEPPSSNPLEEVYGMLTGIFPDYTPEQFIQELIGADPVAEKIDSQKPEITPSTKKEIIGNSAYSLGTGTYNGKPATTYVDENGNVLGYLQELKYYKNNIIGTNNKAEPTPTTPISESPKEPDGSDCSYDSTCQSNYCKGGFCTQKDFDCIDQAGNTYFEEMTEPWSCSKCNLGGSWSNYCESGTYCSPNRNGKCYPIEETLPPDERTCDYNNPENDYNPISCTSCQYDESLGGGKWVPLCDSYTQYCDGEGNCLEDIGECEPFVDTYGTCPDETPEYICEDYGGGIGYWSSYQCSDYGECTIGETWGLCDDFFSPAYTCDDYNGYGYWSGYLCSDTSADSIDSSSNYIDTTTTDTTNIDTTNTDPNQYCIDTNGEGYVYDPASDTCVPSD